MTTLEFKTALDNANTLEQLSFLRSQVSSKMVKLVKDKIETTLGMESFVLSTTSLKALIGADSDTNTSTTMVIPAKNRTLAKFVGKKVLIYVQSKLSGGARSVILVKQI